MFCWLHTAKAATELQVNFSLSFPFKNSQVQLELVLMVEELPAIGYKVAKCGSMLFKESAHKKTKGRNNIIINNIII